MLVVGLTGGIATGKSTVSKLFASHQIPIIDADLLARRVVEPGTPALKRIVQHFGTSILLSDGTLDRRKLGEIVFNDDAKRKVLNGIVHPAVRWAMLRDVVRCWMKGDRVCILDVPLLIEAKLWKWVGRVVVVYCSQEIEMHRLIERDHLSRDEARARLKAQMPIAEKLDYADYVVDNSGPLSELQRQVTTLVRKMDDEAGWTWKLSWLFPPFGVLSALLTIWWRLIKRGSRRRKARRRGDGEPIQLGPMTDSVEADDDY